MKFIFDNNRTALQQRVYDAALSGHWLLSDVFNKGDVSTFGSEQQRLKWAPVLSSLAFGEATAFAGFGARISGADDVATKSWLAVHLVDESRHTEGFSRLLDYLYPSVRGGHEQLLKSRDVQVFYGHTHRCRDLLEWLICTQIAEVFGMHCYKALRDVLAQEPVINQFFSRIIGDEGRHIAFVASMIQLRREALPPRTWLDVYLPFAVVMTKRARRMFAGSGHLGNRQAFIAMGVDVEAFCDAAESALTRFFDTRGAT